MDDQSHISKQAQIAEMITESYKKPLVLVFSATWLSQSSIVEVIYEKIRDAATDANVVAIDADEDEEVLVRFNISDLPAAVIIHDHKITYKREGIFSKKMILDELS